MPQGVARSANVLEKRRTATRPIPCARTGHDGHFPVSRGPPAASNTVNWIHPMSPLAAAPPLDPIALLKADHKTLSRSLESLAHATAKSGRRAVLLEQVARQIRAHAAIEEEIFYPAYRTAAQTKGQTRLFYEAKEAHELVSEILEKLLLLAPTDETFAAKAKVLKELVEHHAEEEEGDMFPAARDILTPDQLDALGVEMSARKRVLAYNA